MMPPSTLTAAEAIARRRATRRFDPDRPLPVETLKELLHLATLAPSGDNLQPWRFVVVRSKRNRERLKGCAFGQSKVAEAPAVVIVLGYQRPHETDLEAMLAEAVRRGALTVEAAAATRATAPRSIARAPSPALWATRSAMLAAATLMIAAESLGVASAPLEGFDESRLRHEFGVPDDHAVCCLVALGFAAERKPFPGRFGLERVCFEEHFGQPWTLGNPSATEDTEEEKKE
ncbi:MAG TPA: nitroreductase family protein [Isosphaeraceae bacterium]|jgi:nitroreductase|nr:nitroreductase family protein [Isosphaeraceae bacterium]